MCIPGCVYLLGFMVLLGGAAEAPAGQEDEDQLHQQGEEETIDADQRTAETGPSLATDPSQDRSDRERGSDTGEGGGGALGPSSAGDVILDSPGLAEAEQRALVASLTGIVRSGHAGSASGVAAEASGDQARMHPGQAAAKSGRMTAEMDSILKHLTVSQNIQVYSCGGDLDSSAPSFLRRRFMHWRASVNSAAFAEC